MTAWVDCVLSVAVPEVSGSSKPWMCQDDPADNGAVQKLQEYVHKASERLQDGYDRLTRLGEAETSGRFGAVRRWLEESVPLLQLPEYLADVEPPGLCDPSKPPSPPLPREARSLSEHWKRHHRYVAWKRYQTVRDAVSTDAIARCDLKDKEGALRRWTNRWLEAAQEAGKEAEREAAGNGRHAYPQPENFDPRTERSATAMEHHS